MVLSNKTKIKLSLGIIILLVAIISGFWAYNKFYVKTPEYTIKATVNAVNKHDWKSFQQYVDVDSFSDSIAEPLLMSAIESQAPLPANTKEVLSDWIKMFKAPMTTSIKEGLKQYVEHGDWNVAEESQDSEGAVINPKFILEQIGITDLNFVDITSVEKDPANQDLAYAKVMVKYESLDKQFPLEVKLERKSDGYWKIVSITNFQDFMDFVQKNQKEQMQAYLKNTKQLYDEYSKQEAENESKLSGVLAAGTLGNDATRNELSSLIKQTVIPQLQDFKTKLQQTKAPAPAQTLQYLRLQIIDKKIAYYQAYENWLNTKNIEELRKATDSLNQFQTMQDDADALLNRISQQVQVQ